jgi:hypothetical protein
VTAARAATSAAAAAAVVVVADAGIVTDLRRKRLWPGRCPATGVAAGRLVRSQFPFSQVRRGRFIGNGSRITIP